MKLITHTHMGYHHVKIKGLLFNINIHSKKDCKLCDYFFTGEGDNGMASYIPHEELIKLKDEEAIKMFLKLRLINSEEYLQLLLLIK